MKNKKTKKIKGSNHENAIKVETTKSFEPSKLIEEIGNLTIKIQSLHIEIESMKERLLMYQGHIREKENKLNLIRSLIGK